MAGGHESQDGQDARSAGSRWQRRSVSAALLRLLVLCAPVGTSFAAAWTVHRALPPVTSHLDRVWHLALLAAVSTVTLVLVDRLGRRLLPLVTLLDLSMLFPDRAPSRLRVARDAIRRRPIEEQLSRVRDAGADPGAVAREILTLVAALSAHDKPTRGHAERVRMFTDLLAEQLRIPKRDRDLLRWAAILHDIGKLQVPASLLNKPGKPTEDEWVVLKAHPVHGAETAVGLLPWLGEWADVIVEHHERYDGTGYPRGLAGTGISLGARIVSVADAYDVMTAARPYKRPVSRAAALQELIRFSGSQFDPQVVRAMVAVGAPRLRRAQGLVAWLADVPLVAGAVPAATVARVVGAGALATGAVAAGATATALPTTAPPAAAAAATSSAEAGDTTASPGPTGSGRPDARRGATDLPGALPGGATPDGPAADGTATEPAPPSASAPDDSSGPGDGSGSAPGRDPGSGEPPAPSPAPTKSPVRDAVEDPVKEIVKEIVEEPVKGALGTVGSVVGGVSGTVGSTVEEVAKDPVGTVAGTVGGTVADPVGTVAGTVGTLAGTVGGSGGSLLGGSSGSSGSSGSGPNSGPGSGGSGSGSSGPGPNSGPGSGGSGGLLGGVLGR